MQAMAATPTPPAIRKPLPSPAAAVESCLACLPARRAADAKRENIVLLGEGTARSMRVYCKRPALVDGEEGSLISFAIGRACHPNRAGAFADLYFDYTCHRE